MFDWLREIKDNIVAEIDLATADPSPELCASVKRAMENEDADLCGEINDSMTWLGHGRILGDMEAAGLSIDDPVDEIAKAIGWPQDKVRETVKTERFIRFLKEKMYVKDQIRQMGVIANHLKKNKNNIEKTAAQYNVAKEYVNTVLKLLEEFEDSEDKENNVSPINTNDKEITDNLNNTTTTEEKENIKLEASDIEPKNE